MDWLPVNLLFCAMLMTGFLSLKALAVPMVTIFKNLTNVVILAGDWYFHGASISTGYALTHVKANLTGSAPYGIRSL